MSLKVVDKDWFDSFPASSCGNLGFDIDPNRIPVRLVREGESFSIIENMKPDISSERKSCMLYYIYKGFPEDILLNICDENNILKNDDTWDKFDSIFSNTTIEFDAEKFIEDNNVNYEDYVEFCKNYDETKPPFTVNEQRPKVTFFNNGTKNNLIISPVREDLIRDKTINVNILKNNIKMLVDDKEFYNFIFNKGEHSLGLSGDIPISLHRTYSSDDFLLKINNDSPNMCHRIIFVIKNRKFVDFYTESGVRDEAGNIRYERDDNTTFEDVYNLELQRRNISR